MCDYLKGLSIHVCLKRRTLLKQRTVIHLKQQRDGGMFGWLVGNIAGKALPYAPGAPITGFKHGSGIWSVREGAPTADASAAPSVPGKELYRSVIMHKYDKKAAAVSHVNQSTGKPEVPPHELDAAKNAMKRMKMLRHPYVLRYLVSSHAAAPMLCKD